MNWNIPTNLLSASRFRTVCSSPPHSLKDNLISFHTLHTIRTMSEKQRLNIRALEPGDADFMYEVENDSSAWRYSDTVAPLSRRILRDYALNYDADPFSAGQIRLIVTEEGNNTPVGIVDLYETFAASSACVCRHLHLQRLPQTWLRRRSDKHDGEVCIPYASSPSGSAQK